MGKTRILIVTAITLLIAACSTPATKQPSVATTPAPKALDLSGEWLLTTHSRVGTDQADMRVIQTGNTLTGTLTSARGSVPCTGSVDGNTVVFGFTLRGPGNDFKIDYSGIVEGDTMHGKTVFGGLGEGTFTAKRKGL